SLWPAALQHSALLHFAPLRSRKATSSLPSSSPTPPAVTTHRSQPRGGGDPRAGHTAPGPQSPAVWALSLSPMQPLGRPRAMGIKTALPAAELGLYSLVLSGALAYAGRGLLEASQGGAHRRAFRESVRPGWEYIGRKMDVADFEWVMWFTSFRNAIIFALSGHVSQVEPVRREGELWRIRAQAGLSVVAIVAVDIFFHFFYILTIPSDLKFASRLPDSALALYVFAETHFDRGINDWLCRYVYDHVGGEHSAVIPELGATVATFAITTLWLGPCDTVYLWSCLNCFGLNFELWVQKLAEWGPLARIEASLSEQMSRRVRAIFGAMNFWAIIMYNLVSLNSFEFTELVAQRLLLTGFPQTTLAVLFVTYCGVQLVKERERTLMLEEQKQDKEKPE
ncbi:hypothetical protein E2I00_006532, partial [Balaenoptera physalus]